VHIVNYVNMVRLIIECDEETFYEFKKLKLEYEKKMRKRLTNEDVLKILLLAQKSVVRGY